VLKDLAAAFQFLTRLPLARLGYAPDALARSAKFFPLVGALIGLCVAEVFHLLAPHLTATIAALLAVLFSVLLTGALHEDGLADAADAFGGGWTREQVLTILKDSRVGTYGALAVAFSLMLRILLIASLPAGRSAAYIIGAHALSRWTILPLGAVLPSARQDAGQEAGQGARLARQISMPSLLIGTLFAAAIAGYLLRSSIWAPAGAAVAVATLTALYYRHRIGGVTGDCFGATTQLTEIAVYLCGVWRA
jgi:adenosylcobinamide-GDP ribazoletransferase